MEINLTELQVMRSALDVITITGKDATSLARLQAKLDNEIAEMQASLNPQSEEKKPRK